MDKNKIIDNLNVLFRCSKDGGLKNQDAARKAYQFIRDAVDPVKEKIEVYQWLGDDDPDDPTKEVFENLGLPRSPYVVREMPSGNSLAVCATEEISEVIMSFILAVRTKLQ